MNNNNLLVRQQTNLQNMYSSDNEVTPIGTSSRSKKRERAQTKDPSYVKRRIGL